MKRFLVLAMVAVAGVLASGSAVNANHFRHVGHGHYGGYRGGYVGNRVSYGYSSYRPVYSGYGNYGGYRNYGTRSYGYGVPAYGYGQSYGYSAPVYGYGGGGRFCR